MLFTLLVVKFKIKILSIIRQVSKACLIILCAKDIGGGNMKNKDKLYFIQLPEESLEDAIAAHGGLDFGFASLEDALQEAMETLPGTFVVVDQEGKIVYKETENDIWH